MKYFQCEKIRKTNKPFKMIAGENFTSPAVMQAMGSVLLSTNMLRVILTKDIIWWL